jgi:hypothetical protein
MDEKYNQYKSNERKIMSDASKKRMKILISVKKRITILISVKVKQIKNTKCTKLGGFKWCFLDCILI